MPCNGAFSAGGFLAALVTVSTPASAAGRLYLPAAANDLPHETRLSLVGGAVLVYVPGGRFSMGSGPDESLKRTREAAARGGPRRLLDRRTAADGGGVGEGGARHRRPALPLGRCRAGPTSMQLRSGLEDRRAGGQLSRRREPVRRAGHGRQRRGVGRGLVRAGLLRGPAGPQSSGPERESRRTASTAGWKLGSRRVGGPGLRPRWELLLDGLEADRVPLRDRRRIALVRCAERQARPLGPVPGALGDCLSRMRFLGRYVLVGMPVLQVERSTS